MKISLIPLVSVHAAVSERAGTGNEAAASRGCNYRRGIADASGADAWKRAGAGRADGWVNEQESYDAASKTANPVQNLDSNYLPVDSPLSASRLVSMPAVFPIPAFRFVFLWARLPSFLDLPGPTFRFLHRF